MDNEVVATYDMSDNATGLADFIRDAVETHTEGLHPVVYVRDQNGNDVRAARLVRVTLTDGSHVYNLVLTVDA